MLPEEARKNVEIFLKKETKKEQQLIKELIDKEYEETLSIIKKNSLNGERTFSNMLYYRMALGNKSLMDYPSRKTMEYVSWGLEIKIRELGYQTEFDENPFLQMFIVKIKW